MPLTFLIVIALLFSVAITIIMPMSSQALTLRQPVECTLGADCFIQNYVDLDPSEGWKDFTCGPLTYDGHKGVDFRLRDLAQMRAGVAVLAAADGEVLAIRDGMADSSIRDPNAAPVADRECGNGVVLEHAGGWQTQYCHLMQGSIAVAKGAQVKAGDKLGQIGLSGQTEFPHLHLSVRDETGAVVDPYVGLAEGRTCGDAGRNLWHASVREALRYRPTALLNVHFTDAVPHKDGARDRAFRDVQLPLDADVIVFWADLMGLRDGDTLLMRITDPQGSRLVDHSTAIEGNKAVYFQYVGARRKGEAWAEGFYHGQVTVRRDGETVLDETVKLTVGEPERVRPL